MGNFLEIGEEFWGWLLIAIPVNILPYTRILCFILRRLNAPSCGSYGWHIGFTTDTIYLFVYALATISM